MKLVITAFLLASSLLSFAHEDEAETIEYSFDRSFNSDFQTTPNGNAIFIEGDIAYPLSRSAAHPNALLWSKGILIYDFKNRNPQVVSLVKTAMAEIEKLTKIRFKQRTNERDYVLIGTDQLGCWSYIGRNGGAQELNLQIDGCLHKGIIMHELFHALGVLHEQSRYDRDLFVTILERNMIPEMKHNFSIIRHLGNGSYDLNSIMHYSSYDFSFNRQPTLLTRNGEIIKANREYLTAKDIQGINELYANQIEGGTVRPSTNLECHNELPFIDTRSFDLRLNDALVRSNSNLCVTFFDEQYPSNALPERIEEWLSAIKETNGKVEYQEIARGWLSKLIEFFVKLFTGQVDKLEPAKKYHALIQIDKANKQVIKIIFYPR